MVFVELHFLFLGGALIQYLSLISNPTLKDLLWVKMFQSSRNVSLCLRVRNEGYSCAIIDQYSALANTQSQGNVSEWVWEAHPENQLVMHADTRQLDWELLRESTSLKWVRQFSFLHILKTLFQITFDTWLKLIAIPVTSELKHLCSNPTATEIVKSLTSPFFQLQSTPDQTFLNSPTAHGEKMLGSLKPQDAGNIAYA